jgi:glycosyltransferase involved in cell wall biosynthesis
MNLLFVHDHPFYLEGNVFYSGGGLPYNIWNNYLINFNKVVVFGRQSNNLKDKKVKSSIKNVSFLLTKNYLSISDLLKNKRKIKLELKTLITETDVVLVRLPSVLGFIAAEQAFKMNKKVWVEQVGNANEALGSHGSLLGKIAAPFFDFQNKKIVSKADFVTYVTEFKLQKDYPISKSAVTISLSDVTINKILNKKEFDEERFFGDLFKIGLIGGFDAKYKGQNILLKAIALLDENIKKNIKINFIGKGDYQWVVNLAETLSLKDNIEYIGPLESGDQINEFLKSLSLYVQPSMTEGMPRATIESMAMGCPVIGSDVGGLPDIVSDRFIHKKGNVKELSNHIKFLFDNRNVLEEEAILSLEKAIPYLKTNLDEKRLDFYCKMNQKLKN